MNVPVFLAAAAGNANKAELLYVWEQATPEAKAIIVCLVIFSITAWSVMIAKALQMRRAARLNHLFNTEYRTLASNAPMRTVARSSFLLKGWNKSNAGSRTLYPSNH